jgi:hypothetical protein
MCRCKLQLLGVPWEACSGDASAGAGASGSADGEGVGALRDGEVSNLSWRYFVLSWMYFRILRRHGLSVQFTLTVDGDKVTYWSPVLSCRVTIRSVR